MVCVHTRKPKHYYFYYPGIFCVLSGFALLILSSSIYTHVINKNLGIAPDSAYFKIWLRTQKAPHMEVYLFNWTNPEDGHDSNIKPRFTEIGPFKFLEYKEKFDYTFNHGNGTLSFRQKKIWYFDEAASCCSLDTVVTTLNAVLVTISHKTKDYSGFLKIPISMGLRAMSPDLHVRKPVRELLFEGYTDNLLAAMKQMGVSGLPEGGKFGFFREKNDTSRDGIYNMDINPNTKGLVRNWNYKSETKYFKDQCAKVQGTTAEMYPPERTRTSIEFFSGDMCRQLKLDYDRDEDFYGLNTYRYIANTSLLDNGTLIPENRCYCNGECLPSGVMNISVCREGSPSFISLPHFLNADPVYVNAVEGLKPDKNKHQLYQLVEPTTGLVVEAAIKIQMNFHLKPIPLMPIIDDVPTVMFPVLWLQVQAKGPPEVASKINLLLSLPTILNAIYYIILLAGGLLVAIGAFIKVQDLKSQKKVFETRPHEVVPLKKPAFDNKPTNLS